ncbi:MAG: phosphoadenosine phosphosulfate reductase domain-containing protein [Candidatus Hodarchaeales archaeon]
MSTKIYSDKDVYTSTIERLDFILDEFEKIYLSFSGGKDSSVLLHLLIERAELKGKLPVNAMFVDFEGQYKATINHVEEMFLSEKVNPFWICLPINLRNAVSVYQSFWRCWDPAEKDKWIREISRNSSSISPAGSPAGVKPLV